VSKFLLEVATSDDAMARLATITGAAASTTTTGEETK
jgi:hypothetical protein